MTKMMMTRMRTATSKMKMMCTLSRHLYGLERQVCILQCRALALQPKFITVHNFFPSSETAVPLWHNRITQFIHVRCCFVICDPQLSSIA